MIDAVFVAQAYQRLNATGHDGNRALAAAGIDPTTLDSPDTRLPFRLHIAMLEAAAEVSGDPCFGLHLGAAMDAKNSGVLTYVALSSATVANALRHVKRYYHVLTRGETFEAEVRGAHLDIEYRILDTSIGPSRQNDDLFMMSSLRLMQLATGKRVYPERVAYKHSEPADGADYRRLFGAPMEFAAAKTKLIFDRSVLDMPIHSADPQLLHILERYCQSVIRERGQDDSLMQQVEELAMRLLPDGPPKADAVASALGMSKRTLSRRLQEQGLTYRDLVDELRAGLAQRYLQDRQLRMSEIAYLLGYSDLSAFNHAFRRWTGQPPSAYRRLAA